MIDKSISASHTMRFLCQQASTHNHFPPACPVCNVVRRRDRRSAFAFVGIISAGLGKARKTTSQSSVSNFEISYAQSWLSTEVFDVRFSVRTTSGFRLHHHPSTSRTYVILFQTFDVFRVCVESLARVVHR